jgi:hypothetical protein
MPHGPSGFSPTTVENPVFGPPIPGRGIVLRPPFRVIYGSGFAPFLLRKPSAPVAHPHCTEDVAATVRRAGRGGRR